jgi:diguanylate cyclase (GGDEF)-like protein
VPLTKHRAADRPLSLRREWSRAFTIMLTLVLVASIATFAGIRQLVDQFGGTATRLGSESAVILSLQEQLVSNTVTAHKLLSDLPENRLSFLRQEGELVAEFRGADQEFPPEAGAAPLLQQAESAWQLALTKAGLWGSALTKLQSPENGRQTEFEVNSDAAAALLEELQGPALDVMQKGLSKDKTLERELLIALAGLFVVAAAATAYFRRRMTVDLFRPVASMHKGVLNLQAGDYVSRIEVIRPDELGELAAAFNTMALALYDSHTELTFRATRDELTGLHNRASLMDRLNSSFNSKADRRIRKESVLFIDIDDFKDFNDSLGHEGGDALLVQLAARLNSCVRPNDLVVRLGGDEFAIVVVEDADASAAMGMADRILGSLKVPFTVGESSRTVSVSIGIAQRRLDADSAAALIGRADFAMYMAKGSGKARYQLFDAQVHDNIMGRSALKSDLKVAVASNQLRLEYQPVVDLGTGEILGMEALLRWEHPILGLLAPSEFIALAEESGDIDAIGCWALETATRQAAFWRRSMDHCADLWVAINLSPYQLPNPLSLAAIERILSDPAAQAEHVVLEVTESGLAVDVDGGTASLDTLKRLGVRIAIDDFGTGFSSLSTLARLPVDILKIDRSFVSGQVSGSSSVPMLEGILGLASKLSLSVIAEGIEEPDHLRLLRTLGCEMGQGYLFGRPSPPFVFEAILASARPLRVSEHAR